ncbi:MAG: A/G-specific adenine glycosylase [Oscillospiraceae bacterium]
MLYSEIESFAPFTPEEQTAKETLLSLIQKHDDWMLSRDCPDGHITCSGLILSPDCNHTLMGYHLIYQSVGWIGGHADGDSDLLGVALREAKEETSVTKIYPLTRKILSIDILPVPEHVKHGKIVETHLHYNVTYGLIAPMNQPISDKPDENKDVRWIDIDEIDSLCTEAHMIPIYHKLIERMKAISLKKREIPSKMPDALLQWYYPNHRDLPWRHDANPYHVWVSEIMLQQTRVEAVKGYYARFLEALPDISALANCDDDKLMKLWEGLGYYSRVRNLKKSAQTIMNDYNGIFPQTYDEIRKLSGIGDYTAGAICSICFGLPVPAVDGNVLRVMARVQEDFRNILDNDFKKDITKQLEKVYPSVKDCGNLTQAMIEIGATVCVPNGMPHCEECPLNSFCMAHQNGSVALLPVREKKVKRKFEHKTVFVLQCGDRIAIQKRPSKGLLAGLWELPNVENFLTPEQAIQQCSEWNVKPKELLKIVSRRHVFTHITWEMQGIFLECAEPDSRFVWAEPSELESVYSLPTAFRCILAE